MNFNSHCFESILVKALFRDKPHIVVGKDFFGFVKVNNPILEDQLQGLLTGDVLGTRDKCCEPRQSIDDCENIVQTITVVKLHKIDVNDFVDQLRQGKSGHKTTIRGRGWFTPCCTRL